jgi:hypothetical protein
MAHLRSSPITGPSSLLRAPLPLCPASVLWLSWLQPLELLPSHRDDRFSRSSPKPDPRSRRLYAGRRSSTQQARLDLHPGDASQPRFRRHLGFLDTSSTVHFRSSPWIAPDAVIAAPFPATLTTKALYPSSLQRFEVCSCKPTSEGLPPSSVKHHRWCALPPFCGTGSFVRDTPTPLKKLLPSS